MPWTVVTWHSDRNCSKRRLWLYSIAEFDIDFCKQSFVDQLIEHADEHIQSVDHSFAHPFSDPRQSSWMCIGTM
jgi:hypothetical protein